MSDLISREAAMAAINEYMVGKRCDTDGTMMARLINELVIKQLPPAELGTNLATHGTDCISRQAAIDAINCNITITGRQNAELVAATIGTFGLHQTVFVGHPVRHWLRSGDSAMTARCSQEVLSWRH